MVRENHLVHGQELFWLPIVGTKAIIHHLKALVVQVSNLYDGLANLAF